MRYLFLLFLVACSSSSTADAGPSTACRADDGGSLICYAPCSTPMSCPSGQVCCDLTTGGPATDGGIIDLTGCVSTSDVPAGACR